MKRRIKAKKDEGLDVEEFVGFLKRIHLNDLIDECVLRLGKDRWFVKAISPSNVVLCNVSIPAMPIDNIGDVSKLGFSSLKMLLKYLSTITEKKVRVKFNKNRLDFTREKHGKFSYLLADPKVITSNIEKKDVKKTLMKDVKYYLVLDDFIVDFLSYYNMVRPEKILLKNVKNKISFHGGLETEHNFNIPLGECKAEDFEIFFNGEYVSKVLGAFVGSSKSIILRYGEITSPIVLEEGENFWGVAPLVY
jgi:hypothetical protein